jgi:hypothetical protein
LMHGRGVDDEPARLLVAAYERFPEDCQIADLTEARELLDALRASSPARP